MPVHEGKFECLKCKDVFEAKSGNFTKCKCGESEIEPSYFSYRYRNGNTVNVIESNTYYLENEFVKLPPDIVEIYEEIKKIKEQTGYKYYIHEMYDQGKNGEKYLSQVNMSHDVSVSRYSSERNTISLTLRLRKDEYKGDEKAKSRLSKFLNFIKLIESNELDASKRQRLIDIAEEENIYYDEEPTGETNYTFYL